MIARPASPSGRRAGLWQKRLGAASTAGLPATPTTATWTSVPHRPLGPSPKGSGAARRNNSDARRRHPLSHLIAAPVSIDGKRAGRCGRRLGAASTRSVLANLGTAMRTWIPGGGSGLRRKRAGAAKTNRSVAPRQRPSASIATSISRPGRGCGLLPRRHSAAITRIALATPSTARKIFTVGPHRGQMPRRGGAAIRSSLVARRQRY
mmetsp:Transcript_53592/g.117469  ORF Transcript_53592/g.117469 Transcript_53592/m.117469 type:complete len:207 (-) Transcript_53592:2196-2816(-)